MTQPAQYVKGHPRHRVLFELFAPDNWQGGGGVRRCCQELCEIADVLLLCFVLQVEEQARGHEFGEVHQNMDIV
eukprot:CAMPEP_0171122338 /NCGR_PEP_ID=MMETSP0766_2-20121228/104806_1 /TAXON_ID=439317 /ORGANISM="Gambierdiscus australes, Strain CAWD 149" /LENGTH=73 /DNA_ID=CAMNT_0011585175 /DNA_START=38 /DNA_END=259 /DNA_ORIENTATION=-